MTTALRPPSGWTEVNLGDVIQIVRGVSYKKQQAMNHPAPGMVPVLRATNIDQHLNFDKLVYVPEECVSAEQKLRRGDIVIAASSGSRQVVGKAAQLLDDWFGSFGAFCMGLRPKIGIEPKYIGYFLQSQEYRTTVSKLAAGSNINNLKRSHIENISFPLAPERDQRDIVAKIEELFSDLDAGVAALKRAQANLKRYRASVLKAAVEGKLTEQWRAENPSVEPASVLLERILAERRKKWEEEQLKKYEAKGKKPPKGWRGRYKPPAPTLPDELPSIPSDWVWATVGQLSSKVVDGVHKKPEYAPSGIPFVTVRNLTAGPGISFLKLNYITPEDHQKFSERANPERGDILISKDGTLGVVRLIETDTVFSIFVSVAMIKPIQRDSSDYFAIALTSPQAQAQMVPKGSGLQHIHLEDLREDAIPLPSLDEQREIVEMVTDQLAMVNHVDEIVSNQLVRAQRCRQAILKAAFEGSLTASQIPQGSREMSVSL